MRRHESYAPAGGEKQDRAESLRTQAEAVADEFARLGYSAPQILALFADPARERAHAAMRGLGEPAIRRIITEAVVRWPAVRIIASLERGEL